MNTMPFLAQVEALLRQCDALEGQLRQIRTLGAHLIQPDQLDPQFDEATFQIAASPPPAPSSPAPWHIVDHL